MEGILFYWISWMFWIIATFFMDKRNVWRVKISLWLLLVIIFSVHTFSINGMQLNVSGIFILFSLYIFVSRLKGLKIVYFLICTFIIMLAYVCFHLFELFDPVWLIFPREWMLSLLLVFLAVLLQGNKRNRIPLILLGSIQGEILYSLILSQYSFPYIVSSLSFLDTMALSAFIIAIWSGVEFLAAYFENHFNQFEREKQKLS